MAGIVDHGGSRGPRSASDASTRRRRWRGRTLAFLATAFLVGCASTSDQVEDASTISLRDFSRPEAKRDLVIEVPGETFEPTVTVEGRIEEFGSAAIIEERATVPVETLSGQEVAVPVEAMKAVVTAPLPVGRSWPVESLVGQINGRPIFAAEFFEPIEDRILRILSLPDRVEARRAIVELVRARFEEFIDSELVVSEAESGLSPEQKQGLFSWLLDLREQEIARRGGSTASAEESLLAQEGLSLEEFMARRRDIALASDLLRRKIEPRVIISWREIEQEYERRAKEFNPPALIRIGRIRLTERADGAEKIAEVRAKLEAGTPFAEVATSLGLADGGLWREFVMPEQGIDGLDLSEEFKKVLKDVKEGRGGVPIERGGSVTWLGVLSIERPPQYSLFDPGVQLAIKESLRMRQNAIEQQRYLQSLRRRWVSEDIGKMRDRLVAIAIERYFR